MDRETKKHLEAQNHQGVPFIDFLGVDGEWIHPDRYNNADLRGIKLPGAKIELARL
ncbi:MAG: hypothetical protein H6638_09670 [Ardenticatenales bacterium]|nr:hypothetical protein [Ardenticatenales bacterium]